jgi:hypothetical protein
MFASNQAFCFETLPQRHSASGRGTTPALHLTLFDCVEMLEVKTTNYAIEA